MTSQLKNYKHIKELRNCEFTFVLFPKFKPHKQFTMISKVFIFAVLLCIALTQASFVPNYPVSVPLVTKVVAPAAVVRDVRGSAANVYSAGLGYNYGYNSMTTDSTIMLLATEVFWDTMDFMMVMATEVPWVTMDFMMVMATEVPWDTMDF
ncbi:hypothetical protein CEXT_330291 [Caerostris extrusa]|uniref:Uncharacterized protein n=1 Tax=Caerostris extrusa TaxID=172846 RepID=A0AAV4XHZ5_CAEEX|nr:hypothetical protein CEXT_330291 [Caerostris extrusa]